VTKYICGECGSENILTLCQINPNHFKFIDGKQGVIDKDQVDFMDGDSYCKDCKDDTHFEEVQE